MSTYRNSVLPSPKSRVSSLVKMVTCLVILTKFKAGEHGLLLMYCVIEPQTQIYLSFTEILTYIMMLKDCFFLYFVVTYVKKNIFVSEKQPTKLLNLTSSSFVKVSNLKSKYSNINLKDIFLSR